MAHAITVTRRFGIAAILVLMASVHVVPPAYASGSMTMTTQRAAYRGKPVTIVQTRTSPALPQLVANSAITGTITISETGVGAPYVRVDYWGCYLLTSGQSLRHTTTDADGNFRFDNVNLGLNRLNFYPDYTTNSAYLVNYYTIGGNDVKVYVPATGTLPLNFQLALGGQVTGYVKSTTGTPLPNVIAKLTDASEKNRFGWTDNSGNYAIIGVDPGTYKVLFYPPSNSVSAGYAYTLAGTIVVTAPYTTANVNGVLVDGGSITGTVTSTDAGALSVNPEVGLENLDDRTYTMGTVPDTNNGSYSFTGLMPGHYRLNIHQHYSASPYIQTYYSDALTSSLATTVTVTSGNTTSNIDIALVKGGQIMGKVTYGDVSLGYGAQYVNVEVLNTEGRVMAGGTTNALGIFDTYPGLPTGDYIVRFHSTSLDFCDQFSFGTQYYPGTASPSAAVPVSVTAGSITPNINADISLVLPRLYVPIVRR